MTDPPQSPGSIDEYLASFPAEVRETLQQIRQAIRRAAPQAEERISYRMPTFYLEGNLVHFAAYRKHIGFYPSPSGIEAFRDELSAYVFSKGAVQFPLDRPIPYTLIEKITRFRVEENKKRAEGKKRRPAE